MPAAVAVDGHFTTARVTGAVAQKAAAAVGAGLRLLAVLVPGGHAVAAVAVAGPTLAALGRLAAVAVIARSADPADKMAQTARQTIGRRGAIGVRAPNATAAVRCARAVLAFGHKRVAPHFAGVTAP